MYIWLETTFGTVQKWSLRPLLDSPKGGLNIGILLYRFMPAYKSFYPSFLNPTFYLILFCFIHLFIHYRIYLKNCLTWILNSASKLWTTSLYWCREKLVSWGLLLFVGVQKSWSAEGYCFVLVYRKAGQLRATALCWCTEKLVSWGLLLCVGVQKSWSAEDCCPILCWCIKKLVSWGLLLCVGVHKGSSAMDYWLLLVYRKVHQLRTTNGWPA